MSMITLKTTQGATAQVSQYAAHLCHWKIASGKDVLFVSKKAIFQAPKAIRGGVPICFPQFGGFGPLGQHGFARNSQFEVEDQKESQVTLVLKYDGQQHTDFPYPFTLRTRVALHDNNLLQTLEVTNTGTQPMPFTCALHTYYHISDIQQVRVEGLHGLKYLDNLENKAEKSEETQVLTISHEVDRIYVQSPDVIKIQDAGAHHTIEIRKEGFPDAVVWNPWVDKAKSLADFDDEEYHEMLCIEPAIAPSGPVTLNPGGVWHASQSITVHQHA